MTVTAQPAAGAVTSIEANSIEPIPDSERRGRVRDQFTLWFAANSTALNIFFGSLAITLGLSFGYVVLAIMGPLLSAVGGNDISWIVGFVVPLAAYWIAGTAAGRRAGRRQAPLPAASAQQGSEA